MATDRAADHLHAATFRRATDTRARAQARATLRRLDQQGATINYVTVAEASGVSRSLLYDRATRRDHRLRNPTNSTPRSVVRSRSYAGRTKPPEADSPQPSTSRAGSFAGE